jgi:hypothetical protein
MERGSPWAVRFMMVLNQTNKHPNRADGEAE